MPSFGDVLSWDGTSLRGAGEALATAAKTYEEVYLDLTEVDAEGLEGETAEAEAKARRILADDAEDIQTALESCGNDLTSAGDSVDSTRQVAEDIVTRASGDGLSIVYGVPVPSTFTTDTKILSARQGYIKEITALLEQADDVVTYIEGVFDDLATLSTTAKGPSADVVDYGAHQPPESWTPQDVNDWWTSLTPTEQQSIITDYPFWIGNLDGVPMATRDEANRIWLDIMVADIDEEVENYDGPKEKPVWISSPSGGYAATVPTSEWAALLQRQKDIHALKEQLTNAEEAGGDNHTLLVLDNTGDHFRAAIGTGDIDSADHVVVNTPGMTSTVASTLAGADSEGWGSGVQGTDAMVEETQWQLGRDGRGDESVAGVTWLGYDAPAWDETLTSSSVVSMNEAREGGQNLASFYDGVQATHHGDPHLVAAGHSYGSTTTGLAVEASSAPDDLLVYGSPGLESQDASDLGLLPRDHMYSARADGDVLVGRSGWHSGNAPLVNGTIDAAPDFTHLETDTRANPDYDAGDPESGSKNLQGSSGHSEYTSRDDTDAPRHTPSTSLYNMGSVIAGNGDGVIPQGG